MVVGLTGGIGSGKSTVAGLFAAHHIKIIDTDTIAHQLTIAGGRAIMPLSEAFGLGILTSSGALDRESMRSQAFADGAVREKLEHILHPLIRAQVQEEISVNAQPYIIVVIPLLVERVEWRNLVQRIVVVDCSEAQQIERVLKRSSMSQKQVMSIMSAQIDRNTRLAAADDVIENSGDGDQLREQVDKLHCSYLKLAAECTHPGRLS